MKAGFCSSAGVVCRFVEDEVRKEKCLRSWEAMWGSEEEVRFQTKLVAEWIQRKVRKLAGISGKGDMNEFVCSTQEQRIVAADRN